MKHTTLFILYIMVACTSYSADNHLLKQFLKISKQADTARKNNQNLDWMNTTEKALTLMPDDPSTVLSMAEACAVNGKHQHALKYLTQAVALGVGWDAGSRESFSLLKQNPDFIRILNQINVLNQQTNNSSVAFCIPEKDIIPEGLAYDTKEQCFYLSSLYKCKILKISKDGTVNDFTTEKQDGLRPVVGMKVDANKRLLWACTEVSGLRHKNANPDEMGWSAIFKYNLDTGTLIQKYVKFEKDTTHLFNDLVLTKSGDVYITDTLYPCIYRISHHTNTLEEFVKDDVLIYLNGITINDDESFIYTASDTLGIFRIHLKTKVISQVSSPAVSPTQGIDGLYWVNHSLIGIQNSLSPVKRINHYTLNKSGDRIQSSRIIEMNNPKFDIPTTGTLVGNTFYYIANSQMGCFDNNTIFPIDALDDVFILKTQLE